MHDADNTCWLIEDANVRNETKSYTTAEPQERQQLSKDNKAHHIFHIPSCRSQRHPVSMITRALCHSWHLNGAALNSNNRGTCLCVLWF